MLIYIMFLQRFGILADSTFCVHSLSVNECCADVLAREVNENRMAVNNLQSHPIKHVLVGATQCLQPGTAYINIQTVSKVLGISCKQAYHQYRMGGYKGWCLG